MYIVALVAAALHQPVQYMPPPGYEFRGKVTITEVDTVEQVQQLCRRRANMSGCSWGGYNVGLNWCRVVVMRSQASWAIPHELAHCGGWRAHESRSR